MPASKVECTAALNRDRRWLSEHGWPGQCLGEYGVEVPAVAGLLVQLTVRELGAGKRPRPLPRRQVQRIGHLSRRTRRAPSVAVVVIVPSFGFFL